MGKGIVKIRDRYLVWSTVVDAPITYGLSREEVEEYVKEEHGNEGLRQLPLRMERVEETGTSFHGMTASDVMSLNRAGEDEAEITEAEIYQRYCVERPQDDQ